MDKVGVGAFLIGAIMIGLSLTWTPSSNLLLFGIIITAAGVGLMYLSGKT